MKICGKEIHVHGRVLRVARLAAERYEFVSDVTATVDGLRRGGMRVDLFTFIEKLPCTSPSCSYPVEWDNVAAIPISTFDHWWKSQINGKTRNMVRRAETKGVIVREVPFDDDLVRGISAIYDECPVRQGRAFWHYQKGIDRVRQENATFLDQSVFLGAYHENRLIGFAKLVIEEDRGQAALMQILSLIGERDKAPTNALVAHAVRTCCERAIPYLVYANFSYGKKERDTLSDFKHHNGFQRIDVPRYYVPLTLAGRAALRLGLHRGVATHIPEPVLAGLRRLRSRWHAGSLTGAKEAS
jgi:hypothetical protein